MTPMYARAEKSAQKTSDTIGRPLAVTFVKTLGALPAKARPSVKKRLAKMLRLCHIGCHTKCARGSVQIAGGSGPGRGQQGGVDDGWQTLDTRGFDGNDEGGLGSVGSLEVQVGVGVRDEETNNGNTADIEEKNTDVDPTNSLR